MKTALAYFDTVAREAPTTLQRCLRAAQIVASSWSLLGVLLMFFIHEGSPMAAKLRIFSIGCLLIAAAIYSVLLPLHYILREPGQK